MGSGLSKPLLPHAAISSSKPRDSKPCRATSPRPASRSRSRSEDIAGEAAGSRVSRAARGDSAARAAGGWAALAAGLNGVPGFDAAWPMEPGAVGRWTALGCDMSRSAGTACRGLSLRLTWSSLRAGAVGLAGLCRPTSCGRPGGGGGGPALSGCRWAGSCAGCAPSGGAGGGSRPLPPPKCAPGSDRPGRGPARPPAARRPPARSPETAEVSEAGGARRAARTRCASSLDACATRHASA